MMPAQRKRCAFSQPRGGRRREVKTSELIQKLKKLDALKKHLDAISNELGGDKTNEQLYQEIWEEIEHEYTGMRVVFADLPDRAIHVLAPID
jgi:hypothetical protein